MPAPRAFDEGSRLGGDPGAAKALAFRLGCLLRLGAVVDSGCSMNGVDSLDRRS